MQFDSTSTSALITMSCIHRDLNWTCNQWCLNPANLKTWPHGHSIPLYGYTPSLKLPTLWHPSFLWLYLLKFKFLLATRVCLLIHIRVSSVWRFGFFGHLLHLLGFPGLRRQSGWGAVLSGLGCRGALWGGAAVEAVELSLGETGAVRVGVVQALLASARWGHGDTGGRWRGTGGPCVLLRWRVQICLRPLSSNGHGGRGAVAREAWRGA